MKKEILHNILQDYSCPTYIFSYPLLKERVSYLKDSLPKQISLCFALKANPFLAKYVSSLVERIEVCSPGELSICQFLKIPDEKLVISGVYKDEDTILNQASNLSIFTIESISQFHLLETKAKDENIKIKALIRLTSNNQFGVSEEDLFQIILNNQKNNLLQIIGIQYYSSTQKKSIKRVENELTYLKQIIISLKEKYQFIVEELEYGPGFSVNYFQDSDYCELDFLSRFNSLIKKMNFSNKIILELGRSIASSCGFYLTKVVDIKTNGDENYVIVDGGIHHLVYYGQFMASKLPPLEIISQNNGPIYIYNICGSLCTVNDILIKKLSTQKLSLGDFFLFKYAGAYSMCEGISLFLSRNLPKVILIDEQENIVTLREEFPTYPLNFKY